MNKPLVGWSISCSADSVMEKIGVVGFEGVILTSVGSAEMTDFSKYGVTNLNGGERDAVMLGCNLVFSYI